MEELLNITLTNLNSYSLLYKLSNFLDRPSKANGKVSYNRLPFCLFFKDEKLPLLFYVYFSNSLLANAVKNNKLMVDKDWRLNKLDYFPAIKKLASSGVIEFPKTLHALTSSTFKDSSLYSIIDLNLWNKLIMHYSSSRKISIIISYYELSVIYKDITIEEYLKLYCVLGNTVDYFLKLWNIYETREFAP